METLWKMMETITYAVGSLDLNRQTLILTSTLLDLGAVAALAWLVVRGGRERDAALAEQRAALEALRSDLAELLADAEQRAQTLEQSLAAREESLRSVLGEVGRVEEKPPVPRRARPAPTQAKPAPPRPRPSGLDALSGDLAQVARRLNVDPAEARLLRDLEVSLAGKDSPTTR